MSEELSDDNAAALRRRSPHQALRMGFRDFCIALAATVVIAAFLPIVVEASGSPVVPLFAPALVGFLSLLARGGARLLPLRWWIRRIGLGALLGAGGVTVFAVVAIWTKGTSFALSAMPHYLLAIMTAAMLVPVLEGRRYPDRERSVAR